jgi:hypothetical protein
MQNSCRRSPQGGVMHTEKDAEIVDWLGRIGAAGAEHVMERFAMGRSWAYARLSKVARACLDRREHAAVPFKQRLQGTAQRRVKQALRPSRPRPSTRPRDGSV